MPPLSSAASTTAKRCAACLRRSGPTTGSRSARPAQASFTPGIAMTMRQSSPRTMAPSRHQYQSAAMKPLSAFSIAVGSGRWPPRRRITWMKRGTTALIRKMTTPRAASATIFG